MQLLCSSFSFIIVVQRISKATMVFVFIFVLGYSEKVALQAMWDNTKSKDE